MNYFIINGVTYYQPECECKNTFHICYMRPAPQLVKLDINKLTGSAVGTSA